MAEATTSRDSHTLDNGEPASPPSAMATADALVNSFVKELNDTTLEDQLEAFVLPHACHHRPIVLVSSGGTVADLEVHSVRCLDNFSTGTRGAISVEHFLRKGYAVIHLWRSGSAAPYSRILFQLLQTSTKPNQGLSTAALGKLFASGDVEEDHEDQLVQTVLRNNEEPSDPWLTEPASSNTNSSNPTERRSKSNGKQSSNDDNIALHRKIRDSSRLKQALQERQAALQEGRLLTVPFRSVEEYLAKLKLCSLALRDCQSLAMLYLAAAVSDFYVPKDQRAVHKIQSSSSGSSSSSNGESSDGLTLTLAPVPKTVGLLREDWAPAAFCCSFKLETNSAILRTKAERAVRKYGCHMVIGNILETRYKQVWILAPPASHHSEYPGQQTSSVQDWPMRPVSASGGDGDGLEGPLIDAVVQAHFEHISRSSLAEEAGAEAMLAAHEALEAKKVKLQKAAFWKNVQDTTLEWAGVAAGAVLSYLISSVLRRRIQGP